MTSCSEARGQRCLSPYHAKVNRLPPVAGRNIAWVGAEKMDNYASMFKPGAAIRRDPATYNINAEGAEGAEKLPQEFGKAGGVSGIRGGSHGCCLLSRLQRTLFFLSLRP